MENSPQQKEKQNGVGEVAHKYFLVHAVSKKVAANIYILRVGNS
jgi:hypothetical protein